MIKSNKNKRNTLLITLRVIIKNGPNGDVLDSRISKMNYLKNHDKSMTEFFGHSVDNSENAFSKWILKDMTEV